MESRRSGIVVAAAGLVLVVVLFVLLSGGGDDGSDQPASSGDGAAAPTGGYGSSPVQADPQPKPGKPDGADEPEVPTGEVRDGEPVDGVQELEFQSGSQAEFAVESDAADELHLHGYDLYIDVEPGKAKAVSFDADIEGVFELESHTTGVLFAEISVVPD